MCEQATKPASTNSQNPSFLLAVLVLRLLRVDLCEGRMPRRIATRHQCHPDMSKTQGGTSPASSNRRHYLQPSLPTKR